MNIITIEKAESIQKDLATKVVLNDEFGEKIKIIAGCDVEYNNNTDLIAGAVVLIDFETHQLIEVATHCMYVEFPYIPGLFSFREMPPLIEAFNKLSRKPDLIVCDAQGIAHPRGLGLASHLGLETGIPTIGCAKKRLFGKFEMPAEHRGAMQDLLHEETNEIIGKVVRTQKGIKPVFVSPGHKISHITAANIVINLCSKYRLPETTRLADQYARTAFFEYFLNLKKSE